jgi:regulatory protein
MPNITSIKPQKNGTRVNIYLDGEFGFGLDLENYVKLGLKVEQKLSEDEVEEIVKKAEFQKIYDKILRFASLRTRSEKEYKGWLKKHKIHESLHNKLFDKLRRLDFLDDRKFAFWWVEQRMQFRPKSKRVLKQELKFKGIDKGIIDEVLEETKIDEISAARSVIKKKKYMWETLEGYEKRVKMSNYLARNGYSWETIRKVVGEFDHDSQKR